MPFLTDQVDELFAGWDRPDTPGCALAIIQHGEIVYKRCYGMADLERNVPLSPTSVFDLGSTGKQFTAMVIAILAEQGVLYLDDSIDRFVPEIPAYGKLIAIRHLIHHTSGLRDYTTLMHLTDMRFENFYYEQELLDLILQQKELNFEPGTEHLYCNTGYFLLGIIAKRVTGKPLPELIRELVLAPLGMQATDFNDDGQRIVRNRAIGHSPTGDGGYSTEMSLCGGYGDGAVLSTVEDLFLWDQNFYNNRLGQGRQALIQQVLRAGELDSGERLRYAFGLVVSPYKGLTMVSHGGGWAGYRAELIRFPDQQFSVICLANLTSINPSKLAKQVADLYLASAFTQAEQASIPGTAKTIELSTSQVESIVGFYRNPRTGNILELSTSEGKLIGVASGLSFEMIATSSTHLEPIDSLVDLQIELHEPSPDGVPIIIVECEGDKPERYRKMAVIPMDPSSFGDYVGLYHSTELKMTYAVLLEAGQLLLRRGYSPKEPLKPVTQDLFTSSYLNLEFVRNERNAVNGFTLSADRVRNIQFAELDASV